MDTAIKAEWVDALRSGDYAQGGGVLRRGNNFCCLGVLCDIAVKHGVIDAPSDRDPEFYETDDEGLGDPDTGDIEPGNPAPVYRYGERQDAPGFLPSSETALPKLVREWAGIDESLPTVRYWDSELDRDRETGLHTLNDEGQSFTRIAELIEAGL